MAAGEQAGWRASRIGLGASAGEIDRDEAAWEQRQVLRSRRGGLHLQLQLSSCQEHLHVWDLQWILGTAVTPQAAGSFFRQPGRDMQLETGQTVRTDAL